MLVRRQCGFRSGLSTENAVHILLDYIIVFFSRNYFVVSVLWIIKKNVRYYLPRDVFDEFFQYGDQCKAF